jgi:polyhydroxyalkanoate synthesis regulator phasin
MKRAILMVIVFAFIASLATAQDPPSALTENRPRILTPYHVDPVQRHGEQTDRYVQKMANSWKEAKDAEGREKIEKSLRDALTKEFEVRMEAHEREVKELEKKVRQLRERLALRKEKQVEIVENRLEQILREAQGLGWGTDAATSYARPSYFVQEQQVVTPYVLPAPPRSASPARATSVFRPTPILQTAPEQPVESPEDESSNN